MKSRLAVLDDEQRMAEIIGMVLRREEYEVEIFNAASDALKALEERPFDLLLTDLKMPDIDGVEVLKRARAIDADLPVILMTAHASIPTAIEAIRCGAFDYVEKPFDNVELKALVARALDVTRLTRENRYLRAEVAQRYSLDSLVAESDSLREVFDLARRAARSAATVLISGESGTGKELVARAVHYYSDRVGGPFVAVNCKALAEGVLESEIFGHEKGAFTGAHQARVGLFERAHGGTLFLDEIGEISADFQVKILRVLQERTFRRVGGGEERTADTRIVAATNRDLREAIATGDFREDLYFRLAVIPIQIPPLRDRPEDILPLATHFLELHAGRLERRIVGWSPEVEEWLTHHSWPGNARELENTLERGVVLARAERLEIDDLLLEPEGAGAESPAADGAGLQEFLDAAAADRIRQVLSEAEGVRTETARRLGVDRTTLYRLMRKFQIHGNG
ncbi:MAG: sigma-54-dependent transcriptional regulator [Myxococcota bacterium]